MSEIEVFRLFGTISINKAKAIADLKAVESAGRKTGGRLSSIFGKIGRAAKLAFAGIAAAGAGIFAASIKSAADFEQAMAAVQAVSGATGEEFDELTKKAKQLGKDTKFTMTEIASGMEALGRAGFRTQEIIQGMDGVTALASATMTDLGEAAQITATTIRQFGLDASEADRVANVFAATTATSNTTVQSLAESMKYFGPVAKAFNIPLEEAAGVVGKLGDRGMEGTLATRTLATSLMRLAAPTDDMQDLMDQLNLELFDSQGNFVGLTEMVRRLEAAFQGLTPQQQMAAEATLFGAQAVKQWNALLSVGSDELAKYTDQVTGTNEAFRQQEIRLNTLRGQWDILKGSISLLLQTIGQDMMPILRDVLKNAIIPWINGITEWIEKMGGVKAIIGRVLIAMGHWLKGIGEWLRAHVFLNRALTDLWDLLKGLGRFIKDVFTGNWSAAWDDVKSIVSSAVGVIKNLLLALWDALPIPEATKNKIITVLGQIKDGAVSAFDWIKKRAVETWQGTRASVEQNAPGIITAWDGLKEAAVKLWDAISSAFAKIGDAFSGNGEAAISWRDVVKGAFDVILTVVTTALNTITNALNLFSDLLNGDWSQAWIDFKKLITDVWNGIIKVLDIIGLKDAIIAGWTALKTKTSEIWNAIKSTIMGAWDSIQTAINKFLTDIKDWGIKVVDSIKQGLSSSWHNVTEWFSKKLQGLVDSLTSWMPGFMKKWLGVGEEAGQKMAEGLDNSSDEIKRTASDVKDAMLESATPSEEEAKEIGHKTAQGIAAGLTDEQTARLMYEAAGELTDAQIEAFEKAAGIKSPAKEFIPIGEAEGEGVYVGLIRAGDKLIAAGKKLVEDTAGPMKEVAKKTGEAVGKTMANAIKSAVQASSGDLALTEANAAWEMEKTAKVAADAATDAGDAYTLSVEKSDIVKALHEKGKEVQAELESQSEEDQEVVKSFWERVKDKVDKGTTDVAEVLGGWLNNVKSTLKSGLGDMLVDIVHFGQAHAEEEEAHLQKIAEINKDYDERIRNASAEDRVKLEQERQEALKREEQEYQESRTTIVGIVSKGFNDMANAILNSALKTAVDTAIDWLWGLAMGAQSAMSAAASAVSSGIAGIGSSLSGLGAVAGVALPVALGTGMLSGPIHQVNQWLNRLFGQHQPGDVWQQGGQTWHQLPAYAAGGVVPGPIGAPQLAVVHGGETITPPGAASIMVDMRGLYDGATINVRSDRDIEEIARETFSLWKDRMRALGRNV